MQLPGDEIHIGSASHFLELATHAISQHERVRPQRSFARAERTLSAESRQWDRVRAAHENYERIANKQRTVSLREQERLNDGIHAKFHAHVSELLRPTELTSMAARLERDQERAKQLKVESIHEKWHRTTYIPAQRKVCQAIDSEAARHIRSTFKRHSLAATCRPETGGVQVQKCADTTKRGRRMKGHLTSWEIPRKPTFRVYVARQSELSLPLAKPQDRKDTAERESLVKAQVFQRRVVDGAHRVAPEHWSPTKLSGTMALHQSYHGIGPRRLEGPISHKEPIGSHFQVPVGFKYADAEWRVARKRRLPPPGGAGPGRVLAMAPAPEGPTVRHHGQKADGDFSVKSAAATAASAPCCSNWKHATN